MCRQTDTERARRRALALPLVLLVAGALVAALFAGAIGPIDATPVAQAGEFFVNPHDTFLCTDCHDYHGSNNLFNIWETLDTPSSGPRTVNFLNLEGPNSFADGDAVYDGVCEVCHTATDHHRNDGSGDHTHYAGWDCSVCHDHWDGFRPIAHPQANTDCSNCHLDRDTGQPDLLGIHGADCQKCHPIDFSGTILGPIGSWNGECSACHNPAIPETGNLEEPTKGHRCVVCHGQQMPVSTPAREMHQQHAERANCVVCHGFIPDVGTQIGSGDRSICALCHDASTYQGVPQTTFHQKHVQKGLSCFECHGDVRPPVDIIDGPPVGNSTRVCQTCHTDHLLGRGGFSRTGLGPAIDSGLHKDHAKKKLDCGSCHIDAELQDDRVPMPPIDDSRRSQVDRSGSNECSTCHGGGKGGSVPSIHKRHVGKQWQWCYNCHEGTDDRPLGNSPPITTPAESCALCHSSESYNDPEPFDVHREHADKDKCYACHQATPDLFDWPPAWMTPGN